MTTKAAPSARTPKAPPICFMGRLQLSLDLDLVPGRNLFAELKPPAFRRFRRRDRSADALPASVQSGQCDAARSFEVAKEQLSGHRLDQRGRGSPLFQG